jgi:uncharacterized membrane protein
MKYSGLLFIIIGIIGLIVSLLLILENSTNYCISSTSCSLVLESKYSYLFGIPLRFVSFFGFLALTIIANLYTFTNFFPAKPLLLIIIIGSAFSSILSLYLIYIELYVLHVICLYCTILHFLIFTTFATSTLIFFKKY